MQKLLLLHEALGSSKQFGPLINALKNDFEIYAPDFPGHGGTVIPVVDFSMRYFADFIFGYMDENNIDNVNVFGYSLGGYVALLMAKFFPERVNKIFTFAVTFDWNETSAKKKASKLIPDVIESKVPRFADELSSRHAPSDWKELVRKTAEYMLKLGSDKELYDNDISSIEHKVRLGAGDKDELVSVEDTVRVYRLLKNGELSIFPGTYHPIEKMDIDKLAEDIKNFFN